MITKTENSLEIDGALEMFMPKGSVAKMLINAGAPMKFKSLTDIDNFEIDTFGEMHWSKLPNGATRFWWNPTSPAFSTPEAS